MNIRNILAPTDLSDSGIPALRYARLFADRCAARLTVMYTDPIVYPIDLAGPGAGLYIAPESQHEDAIRKEVEQHVATHLGSRAHDVHVTVGQPIPSILAAAKTLDSDLIVMGTHLRHGWRRALLGSVSEGVLHGSACPVLTVANRDAYTGAMPYAVTNIVCPVNFTDVARQSLVFAAKLGEVFGAKLTIVHVLENGEAGHTPADEERVRRWIRQDLQDVCAYRELVVRGGAAERVLDCADDVGADLLVVGAQHKLFRDATVIGTTTERLIRFASCPVLVVPREAARHKHVAREVA